MSEMPRTSRALTPPQHLAAHTFGRPVAVTAAAGSGKTTVLIERYLNLLAQGLKPSQILLVTFTNEAADQLKSRIVHRLKTEGAAADAVADVEQSKAIGTLHSFCFRVLQEFGSLLGLPPISGIVDTLRASAQWYPAYRDWWEQLTEGEIKLWLSRYSRFETHSIARELVPKMAYQDLTTVGDPELAALVKTLVPLKNALEARFLRKGLFRFDELEAFTEQILEKHESARKVLQERFRAVCVDEFQDTSPSQWRILLNVLGDDKTKLFVVGDPKQSIYSFRGADVSVFLNAVSWIEDSDGLHVKLSENFRSQPKLLSEINRLSGPLFETSAVPFEPMLAGLESESPAECRMLPYEGVAPEGEADRLIDSVKTLLDEGVPPGQIALLFRVSDRIGYFESRLQRAGIPARSRKTVRIFQQYEFLDLAAYLRALVNPTSNYNLAAFLRSAFAKFSYADMARLHAAPGETLLEKLKTSSHSVDWFLRLLNSDVTLKSALKTLFAETRWLPSNPTTLLKLLEGWENENVTLKDCVERLESWQRDGIWVEASEKKESSASHVTLLTVHAAKGLEFDHVFLVDGLRMSPNRTDTLLWCDSGLLARHRENGEWIESEAFQVEKERLKIRDAEEACRILYVALTRARVSLTIMVPPLVEKAPRGSWVRLFFPRDVGGEAKLN